jgi:anti-sigma factor RsiW
MTEGAETGESCAASTHLMTCRELIDFIADYLAGELEESEGNEFERHLILCSSCRAYLASYRQTLDLLADDSVIEDVPEELVQAILRVRR